MDALPSDVLTHAQEFGILDSIAWDTETSGLFVDDGARMSTTSIAFVDPQGVWREFAERFDNAVWQREEIAPEYEVDIFSIAWPFDQGLAGKPEDTGQGTLWPDAENLDEVEWAALLDLLASYYLDAHNAKFDLHITRVGCRRWPGVGKDLVDLVVWDTQNVNAMLWGLHPTSLKPTCARIFGKEWADESQIVKKYLAKHKLPAGRWDLMPWEVIGKYAETDARITKMLKLRQIWEIENNNAASWIGDQPTVMEFVHRRLEVMKVLYRMERRGIPYDEVTSREAGIECRQRAAKVAEKLPFGATVEKAKKFYFSDGKTDKGVECLDMVPYSVTDKGAPQLTAEIALRMEADRVPFAAEWGEFSRVSNAASMWYEGYADGVGLDGRIRATFRQNGTRSSRFSVERLNLQAIPQDYRLTEFGAMAGIITPRGIIANAVPDGWRLFELDLAQAELRVATMFAGCTTMRDMIMAGEDLHKFTTESLFDAREGDADWGKWRQVGKRGNFSLLFGSGGPTFKKMVSKETGILLTDNEAERIVRDWNGLYPEFGRAIYKHQNVVARRQARHGHGWVDFTNKERRWFQPYEEAHKAFNQRVQGNLGQFGIDWMLMTEPFLDQEAELQQRAANDGIGEAGLVMTIHDSQVLLLPDNSFGEMLAAKCADFGKELWKQMFPEIPGDVDYHAWERTAA